jgi:lycopene cyclase domain-containing protein
MGRAYFRKGKTGRVLGMAHLHYLGVLLFIGICAVGVTLGFKIRVPGFWKTFLFTDIAILVIYLAWDIWAISKRNWYFDHNQILSGLLINKVPLEEILFFIIVPLTTIVTYKALLKLTGWESKRP